MKLNDVSNEVKNFNTQFESFRDRTSKSIEILQKAEKKLRGLVENKR